MTAELDAAGADLSTLAAMDARAAATYDQLAGHAAGLAVFGEALASKQADVSRGVTAALNRCERTLGRLEAGVDALDAASQQLALQLGLKP